MKAEQLARAEAVFGQGVIGSIMADRGWAVSILPSLLEACGNQIHIEIVTGDITNDLEPLLEIARETKSPQGNVYFMNTTGDVEVIIIHPLKGASVPQCLHIKLTLYSYYRDTEGYSALEKVASRLGLHNVNAFFGKNLFVVK